MFAIVSLRTAYANLGDLLINVILVSSLAARARVICDVADVPQAYLAEFTDGLRAQGVTVDFVESRFDLILRTVRHLAGGAKVTFLLSPGDNQPSRSPQRIVIGMMARLVPRLFIAQVGASWPTLTGVDRFALRGGAKRPGLLSVRDAGSQSRLRSAGIAAAIVPDLAFLQPISHPGGERFTMTFRARDGVAFEKLVGRLQPLIARARDAGLVPGFCWQVASDEPLARRLAAACNAELFQTSSGRPSLGDMRALYRSSAVICSNRLHALLLGASGGAIPMACLSAEDAKVAAAFAAVSLDGFVASDPAGDAGLLQRALQSPDDCHRQLGEAFASASAKLDDYFRAFADAG